MPDIKIDWIGLLLRSGVLAQWAATAICAATSLLISIVLARWLGPESFGLYAFYLGIGAAMGVVLDAGLRTRLLRESARPSENVAGPLQELREMLGHLSLLAGTGLLMTALLGEGTLLALIACFAAVTLTQWHSAWLKGTGALGKEAGWQLACRFGSGLAILLMVLWLGPTPAAIFTGWALGLLLVALPVLPWPRLRPLRPTLSLYSGSLSFAAADLATLIYHRADSALLYLLGDATAAGHYAAAYRLYDGVLLLATPLTILAFRHVRSGSGNSAFQCRMLLLAFLCGALLAGAAWTLGLSLTRWLYGPDYAQVNLLGWLFCALILALPNGLLCHWAIAHHRERYFLWGATLAALVNVLLNIWLIPRHGGLGAAWSTLASEAVLGMVLMLSWQRQRDSEPSSH